MEHRFSSLRSSNPDFKDYCRRLSVNDAFTFNFVVGFWGAIADLLHGEFQKSEFQKIIRPFMVRRRLGDVLEATKAKVL